MPWLQAASANYFGFIPAEGGARSRVYLVSSSEANQISPGDVLVMTSSGLPTVRQATATGAYPMVGVAASIVVANGGSTTADPRVLSSQTVLVYDDPATVFVGCDTTSAMFGQGDHLNKLFQVTATGPTGSTGINTTLNRSVMAISVATASSGSNASYHFRAIGLHPIESAYSTVAAGTAGATAQVRKLLLLPTFHVEGPGGFGVQITT